MAAAAVQSKRSPRRVSMLLAFGLALTCLVSFSSMFPAAPSELDRLEAVDRAAPVVMQVASEGARALTSDAARTALESVTATSTPLALLGAWSKLSIGRLGLLDAVTSARLPWLVLASSLPPALLAILSASRSLRLGWMAALGLVLLPGFLLAAVSTDPSITTVSLWVLPLAVLVSNAGAGQRGRVCAAAYAGALVAAGTALDLGALAAVVLVVLYHWGGDLRTFRRTLVRGRMTVPLAAWAGLGLMPAFVVALRPELWGRGVVDIGRRLAAVSAGGGSEVGATPSFGLFWLFSVTWLLVAGLGLLGAWGLCWRALARRFATGALRPPPDRTHLGALLAAGAMTAAWCALSDVAHGRNGLLLGLPFIAIAAAVGLDWVGARLSSLPRGRTGA